MITSLKALRYGTCFQENSQFYLHTPRSSATEWIMPACAFPAEAGTHLPTPEGFKAELALTIYRKTLALFAITFYDHGVNVIL